MLEKFKRRWLGDRIEELRVSIIPAYHDSLREGLSELVIHPPVVSEGIERYFIVGNETRVDVPLDIPSDDKFSIIVAYNNNRWIKYGGSLRWVVYPKGIDADVRELLHELSAHPHFNETPRTGRLPQPSYDVTLFKA